MEFKVKTISLVAMFDVVQRGVGNSKIMPITEYLEFDLQDGKLTVTATDMNNFISYSLDGVQGESGTAVINANSIIKLAEKTTKEDMKFDVKEDHVEVTGNGKYKIGLMVEEEFPTYKFEGKESKDKVKTDTLKKAFKVNEQSVSREMLTPVLSGYNVGDKLITTDGIKMCINNENLLESDALITQSMVNLIQAIPGQDITISKGKEQILIESDNVTIYGGELEGIDDYPDITPLLDIEHEGHADISKGEILSALDRLIIFSDPFENNGVTLTFKKDELVIEDLRKNSKERIEYKKVEKSAEEEVEISVNIQYLKDLISAVTSTQLGIHYGKDKPFKITQEEIVQILSTMEISED